MEESQHPGDDLRGTKRCRANDGVDQVQVSRQPREAVRDEDAGEGERTMI